MLFVTNVPRLVEGASLEQARRTAQALLGVEPLPVLGELQPNECFSVPEEFGLEYLDADRYVVLSHDLERRTTTAAFDGSLGQSVEFGSAMQVVRRWNPDL